jgi:ubiquinone/menaquinone biosynthesis C-methylase UbiE
VRLNLGCGARVFPDDWINVDIFDVGPPGCEYLKADISKRLPFDDNSADEVFSCHVIEHFGPWEVDDILTEWIRVLKPDSPLVIECPNISGVCRILCEADRLCEGDALWLMLEAIYGDPRYQNIEQRHKWGYTPASLIALLQRLGLKNVTQQPAVFKMREPRDMRVAGLKMRGAH